MRGHPYSPCTLYYDGAGDVQEGHYLQTPAGSTYWITSLRQDKRLARRVHLSCLRWPKDEVPTDAVVHPLHWYPRKRKARARS